jgi:hypothetical protein
VRHPLLDLIPADRRAAHRAGDSASGITFLPAPARRVFRVALPTDEAAWERGRGWALAHGLRCAACSADNPLLAANGRYTISQVITAGH